MSTATTTNNNNDDVRGKVAELAMTKCALSKDAAADLERGIFNWSLQFATVNRTATCWKNPRFRDIYVTKSRSVLSNVDSNSYIQNTRLLSRLKDNEFLPRDVASMPPENVFPERWQKVLDAKLQRDEYMKNAKPAAMTDQFKCRRCKKRECEYQELQIRSCDEPATLFITCLNCGNRWRI
jgi:DNA-directed RNA polymerase subunit M/transcription elongation factor TFIIS